MERYMKVICVIVFLGGFYFLGVSLLAYGIIGGTLFGFGVLSGMGWLSVLIHIIKNYKEKLVIR